MTKTSRLPVRPEPDERRSDAPDAGRPERDPRDPGGRGGAVALRSAEDSRTGPLAGQRNERVQAGPPRRRAGPPSVARAEASRDDVRQVRMTLVEHLDELRTRLLRCVGVLLVA